MSSQPLDNSSPLAYVLQLLKILGLSKREQTGVLDDLVFLIELKTTRALLENLPKDKQEEFREKLEKLATNPKGYIEYLQKLSEDKRLRPKIEAPINEVLGKIEDEFFQRATDKQKQEMLVWLEKNT
jgi:hypothetical protein